MSRTVIALVALVLLGSRPDAQDAFASIRCDTDIARRLAGKVVPKGPVADIEKRHRDIALKDEGAAEVTDRLTYLSWGMCGAEYALLVDRDDVIQEALRVPPHSRRRPAFFGSCV